METNVDLSRMSREDLQQLVRRVQEEQDRRRCNASLSVFPNTSAVGCQRDTPQPHTEHFSHAWSTGTQTAMPCEIVVKWETPEGR